jgi:hypothetical protein
VTPACITDVDCSPFYACKEDATTLVTGCTKVGCTTDRECMLFRESYLAYCDTTPTGTPPVRECVMKCERDSQCRTSSDPLGVCVQGRCQEAGCDSNEECKIRLELNGSLPRGTKAVCRDKVVTPATGA